MKQLTGKNSKVYLSPIEESHILRYLSLSDDPDLISTMGWRPFNTDESDRFIRTVEVLTLPYCGNGQPFTFSIITSGECIPIGYITLKGVNNAKASVELGIAIMDAQYCSGGYGTNAISHAIDYAFNDMRMQTIGLTVFPSNIRAIKAYEKIGFKTTDVLEKSLDDARWPTTGYTPNGTE
ncbi:MAG: GNAT family N-acetyltransferase [Planctomycetes bacterium]|nr:GNAT family N-acetyltransferase [Planctomycetota bacterium]